MEKLYAQDQPERNFAVNMSAEAAERERTSPRTVVIVATTVEPRVAKVNKRRGITIP